MRIEGSKVLLTGAGGGIGAAIVAELIAQGAQVLLVDRDARALEAVASRHETARDRLDLCTADLTVAADRELLCERARLWRGGVDILINNAGLNPFGAYEELLPAQIDMAVAVNLQAPLHLCRALLPHLRARSPAAIVNIGSVFGAIGFPGYAAYCATKFALRGFSEALRRELDGTGVLVQYIAPRATLTPINSSNVESMNRELGVRMDPPDRVASETLAAIRADRRSWVVGWPEKMFVKLNALLPAMVDGSIRKQLPIIRRYSNKKSAAQASATAVSVTS